MWYYQENSEQRGPISEPEIAELLQTRILTSESMVWKNGMVHWCPVTLTELDSYVPPALPPPIEIAPAVTPPAILPPPIDPVPAKLGIPEIPMSESTARIPLLPYAIAVAIGEIVGGIVTNLESTDPAAAESMFTISIVAGIAALIALAVMHYKCWSALPPRFRVTTPGKAVGFLFIPIFNFYWVFVSYPKLAEGLAAWRAERNHPAEAKTKELAVGYACWFCFNWVYNLFLHQSFPTVAVGAACVSAYLFYALYKRVTEEIELLGP